MEDLIYLARWVTQWVLVHPAIPAAVVVALLALRWALNRKGRVVRDAHRDIAQLKAKGKGKYDELRPLR
ncbi:MAG: hypothetical protein QOD06_3476 [Candidatus Binatota bacterium]|jgi:hypothetical protein|nr:hypothetical protein [Candidatus Binatota bacterium]